MDALNAWKYANWSAIAICAGTLLWIAIAGFTTARIRRPRNKKERMPPCGADDAVRWAAERRGLLQPQLPHAIDSSNYRAPYHRVHLIDFERSTIIVLPDGSVHAECSVQGCPMIARIGRNVANATIVPEGEPA